MAANDPAFPVRVQTWPKVNIAGSHDPIARCTGCNLTALETRITRYVEQAINNGPHLCDGCLADALISASGEGE